MPIKIKSGQKTDEKLFLVIVLALAAITGVGSWLAAGTERIAVVDAHGRTRIYFDGLRNDTSAAVVAEIAQLRREP